VKIAWTNSYNNVSGFNVTYATRADYSDGKTVTTDWMTFSIELFNLLKDTTYHVRISPIIKGKDICVESTFRTSALGPRVMNIPNLYNVRDLGGYRTVSGKRTRQGMVFRGSELNDPTCGILLTAEGERYLSEELKIKSDMDLRKE